MKTFRDFLPEAAERVVLDEAASGFAGYAEKSKRSPKDGEDHLQDAASGMRGCASEARHLDSDELKSAYSDAANKFDKAIELHKKHGSNHPEVLSSVKEAYAARKGAHAAAAQSKNGSERFKGRERLEKRSNAQDRASDYNDNRSEIRKKYN